METMGRGRIPPQPSGTDEKDHMHLPLGLPDETHQQEGFLDWPPGSQCGGRVHMDGWKPSGLQVRASVGSEMGETPKRERPLDGDLMQESRAQGSTGYR